MTINASPRPASSPDLLTIAEVARTLRLNSLTITRYIQDGRIPAHALVPLPHGGKRTVYRIKRTWLEQILADNARARNGSIS